MGEPGIFSQIVTFFSAHPAQIEGIFNP